MPAIVELAPRAARAVPHAPNAALVEDAGALATAIGRVWPRPHTAYFAFEPARRKLAGIVAHRAYGDLGALAEPLETWSLKRIVAAYLPDAPDGLVEALRRFDGKLSWEDFRILTGLLADVEGVKVLRHAQRIDVALLHALHRLPPELRRTRIVAHVPTAFVADLVARGVQRACGNNERPRRQLAERLERSRSAQGLFRMLIEAIGLEQLAPPPIPGADWLAPLATVAQIESAALRFENCLKGRIPLLLRGKAAYYEALGAPAVIEIVRDVQGLWVVGEIRGHANVNITQGLWDRIRAHLVLHGARVQGARPDGLAIALAQAAGW
ncbi:hypothetical protein [Terricaulis sp.]|uniref:hypothetical protein n=1 Tax=Terricaulis sp. TaxID=2768686 RepID=UPI0037844D38